MNEKQLVITKKPMGQYWTIGYENGGQLPNKLTGLWTTEQKAQDAINGYVAHKAKLAAEARVVADLKAAEVAKAAKALKVKTAKAA